MKTQQHFAEFLFNINYYIIQYYSIVSLAATQRAEVYAEQLVRNIQFFGDAQVRNFCPSAHLFFPFLTTPLNLYYYYSSITFSYTIFVI